MIHVTPTATSNLTDIYATISKAYARPPPSSSSSSSSSGEHDLQRELDGVKKTLHDTRRATSTDFVCLRVGGLAVGGKKSAGGGSGTPGKSGNGSGSGTGGSATIPRGNVGAGQSGEGTARVR